MSFSLFGAWSIEEKKSLLHPSSILQDEFNVITMSGRDKTYLQFNQKKKIKPVLFEEERDDTGWLGVVDIEKKSVPDDAEVAAAVEGAKKSNELEDGGAATGCCVVFVPKASRIGCCCCCCWFCAGGGWANIPKASICPVKR